MNTQLQEAYNILEMTVGLRTELMTWLKDKRFDPNPSAVVVYNTLYGMYRELHDAFGGVVGAKADLGSLMKRLLDLRERAVNDPSRM